MAPRKEDSSKNQGKSILAPKTDGIQKSLSKATPSAATPLNTAGQATRTAQRQPSRRSLGQPRRRQKPKKESYQISDFITDVNDLSDGDSMDYETDELSDYERPKGHTMYKKARIKSDARVGLYACKPKTYRSFAQWKMYFDVPGRVDMKYLQEWERLRLLGRKQSYKARERLIDQVLYEVLLREESSGSLNDTIIRPYMDRECKRLGMATTKAKT